MIDIRTGAIVEDGAVIGEGSTIGEFAIIRKNARLGKNSRVGVNCILGEGNEDILTIGENAVIRSGTIIYGGSDIGYDFATGHRATIRENTIIGDGCTVGTLSDLQGYLEVGDYVHLHSNVHLGQHSKIDDYVWIFPYVVLTNDPSPPSDDVAGVTVGKFACICTGSIILPGVHIGEDSLVGAGSNVTKDVEARAVVLGNPARKVRNIEELLDVNGDTHYPWRDYFDKGTPWTGIGYRRWRDSAGNA